MASVATGRSAVPGPAAEGPLRRALLRSAKLSDMTPSPPCPSSRAAGRGGRRVEFMPSPPLGERAVLRGGIRCHPIGQDSIVAAVVALLLLGSASPTRAWGGKVNLVRRYRLGQQMVYQTDLQMASSVRSNPDILKSFLPPMPTKLTIRQQNTVTVQAIQPDGSVEIENRFDKFDFQSDLADRLPEELRDSARQAQEEFSRQLMGRSLKAHYDREGRRLGFEGFESMSQGLNSPAPAPLRQILRFFLEQVGGNSLYRFCRSLRGTIARDEFRDHACRRGNAPIGECLACWPVEIFREIMVDNRRGASIIALILRRKGHRTKK